MGSGRQARWLWLSLGVLLADRATKMAIERYTPENYHRVLVPGVVNLVHNRNPGIAFGIFANSHSQWFSALLMVVSAGVAGLLFWLLWTGRSGGRASQVGLALILAGALGNLLDRLLHGSVTDFFEVWIGSFRWPAFNLADSAITVGALLVFVELFFGRQHAMDEKV